MDPVTMAVVGALSSVASNPAVQGAAVDALGEFSPAASAQRRAYKRAQTRLDSGVGYGFSNAQKSTMGAQGNQAVAAQLAAQQSAVSRQQAAGALSGGGATAANRAIAQSAAAGAAQNAANVQAQSNVQAREQFAADTAAVNQQAALARKMWERQGERLYENPIDVQSIAMEAMGAPSDVAKVTGAGVPKTAANAANMAKG